MCTGADRFICCKAGTAAKAAATYPFMSQHPRPISRPSTRRITKGSACHSGSCAGTTSTCPDRIYPGTEASPIVANRLYRSPSGPLSKAKVRHTREGNPRQTPSTRRWACPRQWEIRPDGQADRRGQVQCHQAGSGGDNIDLAHGLDGLPLTDKARLHDKAVTGPKGNVSPRLR